MWQIKNRNWGGIMNYKVIAVVFLGVFILACEDHAGRNESFQDQDAQTVPSIEEDFETHIPPEAKDLGEEIDIVTAGDAEIDMEVEEDSAPSPLKDLGFKDPDVLTSDTGNEVSQDFGVDSTIQDAGVDLGQDIPSLDPDAAELGPDAFLLPPPANPTCDVVDVEQGGRCFNGCDDDLDGILDTLDPSCEGSCDVNNPFCPDGTVCDATSETCEEPIPLAEQFPDPGVCVALSEDHPCRDLCNQLFLSGQSCYWSNGGVIGVKDEDWDLVQDEPVVPGLPLDNCTAWHNPDQEDLDDNGVGDPCDLLPEDQVDEDGDLVPNAYDNCVYAFNPGQENSDGDETGDVCSLGAGLPAMDCGDGDDRTQDQWNPTGLWCEYRAYESQWFFWTHLCQDDRTAACGACIPAPGEFQTVLVFNGWACTVYPDLDEDGRPEMLEGILGQYLDEPFVDQD